MTLFVSNLLMNCFYLPFQFPFAKNASNEILHGNTFYTVILNSAFDPNPSTAYIDIDPNPSTKCVDFDENPSTAYIDFDRNASNEILSETYIDIDPDPSTAYIDFDPNASMQYHSNEILHRKYFLSSLQFWSLNVFF